MNSQRNRWDHQAVAIIGISARFPGANSKDEFLRNQRATRNCITETPPERWRWQDSFGDPLRENARTDSKWGGFLPGLDLFDPLFFGISPFEAELMDPQHRLFVKSCWEAILDAGYPPARFAGTNLSVFVGVQFQEYQQLLLNAGIIRAQVSTGNAKTMLPNRVSFLLDVSGPSIAIDTACSSSLVAIHHAVQAIRSGSCGMALAGGANIMLVPDVHIMGSQMRILSPTGQSRCFDAAADGYVRGEGVGALLLKPLDDAERDRDHIYALIRGSAVSHAGHSISLATPKADSQAAVMSRAMADAGVDSDSISYVEMHATGTMAGDPVEVEGVKRAFAASAREAARGANTQTPCALGSVKSNIGHLEAAAGLAGVINAALAIEENWLPGMSSFQRLNPKIVLSGTSFYVQHQGSAWVLPRSATRRALVNSYGFGGTNASLLLEEHRYAAPDEARDAAEEQVIPLSASTPSQLPAYCEALKVATELLWERHGDDFPVLESIAYTLQHGREDLPARMAIRVSELTQLITALRSVKDGEPHPRHAASSAEMAERNGWPRDVCAWLAGRARAWREPARRPRRVALPAPPWNDKRHWFSAPARVKSQPAAVPAAVEGVSAAAGTISGFVYLEAAWIESAVRQGSISSADNECVLIVGEDASRVDALKEGLALTLPSTSKVVTALYAAWPPSTVAGDAIVATKQGVASWFDRLAREGVRPTAMFILAPRPAQSPADDLRAHHVPVGLVYLLTQQLMARHLSAPIVVYYVAGSAQGASPHEGALEAFAKSAYLENSRFVMNIVYPDEGEVSGQIIKEWRCRVTPTPQMVRYQNGRRFVHRLEAHERLRPALAGEPITIRRDGTYLLPGGAGELGRRLARRLASDYRANVVLLGRATPGDAPLRVLEEIRSELPSDAGEVIYFQCDVTRLTDVDAAVEATRQRFGALHGVLSLVTDHRDAFLFNKSWDDFQAVAAGKVDGTIHLDLATRALDLDFFVLFSSQAALGMAGACDYAYGCEFQNQFAAWRSELRARGNRRGRTLSINWSRWQWDKYVTERFDEWVHALGYDFLDLDTGFGGLVSILGSDAVRLFPLYGDRERILANIDLQIGMLGADANAQRLRKPIVQRKDDVDEMLSRFSEAELTALASKLLTPANSAAEPSAAPQSQANGTAHAAPQAETARVGDPVEAVIISVLSRKLKVDDIEHTSQFADLGVDSVIAVELIIDLENLLHVQMHPNWLFQYPTVAQLAEQIAMVVREAKELGAAVPQTATID